MTPDNTAGEVDARRRESLFEDQTTQSRRRFGKSLLAGTAGALGLAETSTARNVGKARDLQEPIKIGVLTPEPGKNPIGTAMANSAKLAAKQLNDEGGVLGANVEISVKDTKEDPVTGKRKYQELTIGEQVDLTTGVFTSEVLLNLMPSIAQQRTLFMCTSASTVEASRKVAQDYDRFKYFFRTGLVNNHFMGRSMVDFAEANFESMGWDSVAVLAEDYKWTEPISEAIDGALSEVAVDVPINKRYASGTENFSPIYDDIESAGVDAVYVAMAHTGTAAIVQWAKQQRPFEFGGLHAPMQLPSYYEAVNGACRYAVGWSGNATATSAITEKTIPYANAYKAAYGKYPAFSGYITFDAVKQYAEAVKQAESKQADDIIPVLEAMSYTGTTTDSLEYYGKDQTYPHDVKYGPEYLWPAWFQWQETEGTGSQKVIWPEDVATTEHTRPPWV